MLKGTWRARDARHTQLPAHTTGRCPPALRLRHLSPLFERTASTASTQFAHTLRVHTATVRLCRTLPLYRRQENLLRSYPRTYLHSSWICSIALLALFVEFLLETVFCVLCVLLTNSSVEFGSYVWSELDWVGKRPAGQLICRDGKYRPAQLEPSLSGALGHDERQRSSKCSQFQSQSESSSEPWNGQFTGQPVGLLSGKQQFTVRKLCPVGGSRRQPVRHFRVHLPQLGQHRERPFRLFQLPALAQRILRPAVHRLVL